MFDPLCLISSSAQNCSPSCGSLLQILRILHACIMSVVATTIKKGGDIHDGQPILDGLYVRIQTIEMNGKRRTVEQWSTNEVFFDAERFLQSCRSTSTMIYDRLQEVTERSVGRYDSTRSRQDLTPEETSMPIEDDSADTSQNISLETIQNLLNDLSDDIEPDVSSTSSGASLASSAFKYENRKYDPADDLQRKNKMVEDLMRIGRLLNPSHAFLLREGITALSLPSLIRVTNTFRFQFNSYLASRTDARQTVSKNALRRGLSKTFESLAPRDTLIAGLHRTWQTTKDKSSRKGQTCKQLHSQKWRQRG